MRMADLRVWVAALAVLGAGPVWAECAVPPPAVVDVTATRSYSDDAGTMIDPGLDAQHKKDVEPLTEFLGTVTHDADLAWKHPGEPVSNEAGACAVSWIAAWAQGRALLGTMESAQAEAERKWDLAGFALAYLKVRSFASNEQRAVVEPWLIEVADAARAYFDDAGHKRNNHWYWMGLGLGAVGLATESERHWIAARDIAQDAGRDVAADGSLPLELARKSRALSYHAFALMPLVALATLARSQGEDFYAFGDGAIDRLAGLVAKGAADSKVFAGMTGEAQVEPVKPGAGWSQLYALHAPDAAGAKIAMARRHRWLGGDVQMLVRALGAAEQE